MQRSEWFYPTAFKLWGPEENEAIDRVRRSDQWTMGAETEELESEFAAYHGMKHAIATNSGSSANLLSVAALFHKKENPLKRGDKAIVPAIAWSTTYGPLVQHGMDLVVADCDESWNAPYPFPVPDNPKLIVGCSILGNPAMLEGIRQIAAHYKFYFINDNCESLGAWYGPIGEKRWTANFGIMSTHSFFHSHQLSAIECGCILTNDDELAYLCRLLRNHGNAGFLDGDASFDESYRFDLFGYNLRPVEMHAAIAREQLKKLESMCRFRQANWNNMETACIGLPIQIPPKLRNAVRSPFGFNFTVESKDVRTKLVDAFRRNEIDCRLPTGGSFLRHPYAENWRADQSTPVADRVHDTGLFLGLAPFEMSDKIERAVRVMKETL